jgi:hypothetical protein
MAFPHVYKKNEAYRHSRKVLMQFMSDRNFLHPKSLTFKSGACTLKCTVKIIKG